MDNTINNDVDNRNVTPIGAQYICTPQAYAQEDNYVLDLRNSVVSLDNTIINSPRSRIYNKSRI